MIEAMWMLLTMLLLSLGTSPIAFFIGCCCGCMTCNANTVDSLEMEITISGIAAGTSCSACSALNGTFLLAFVEQTQPAGQVFLCFWESTDISYCTSRTGRWRVYVQSNSTSVIVQFFDATFGTIAQYVYSPGGSPLDCTDLAALNIPRQNFTFNCNNTSSTATVTTVFPP